MTRDSEMARMNSVSSKSVHGKFELKVVLERLPSGDIRKHECMIVTRGTAMVVYLCEYLFNQSSFLFSLIPDDTYTVCTPCHQCTCREVSVAVVPTAK